MKIIYVIISILVVLIFFSQCHQPVPTEIKNLPPKIPVNIFPPDDTTDIQVSITFAWQTEDANVNDTLFYDFYLEIDNPNPKLKVPNLAVDSLFINALKYDTTYYWKVVAKDLAGDSSSSPVWKFKTRHEFNAPPYIPKNPDPENNETSIPINNVILQWTGGDPDGFSMVNYDVQFGEYLDSLKIISVNIPDSSLQLSLLKYDKKYFWQIISKDHYGSITEGPVWSFETLKPHKFFDGNFDSDNTNQNPSSIEWYVMESGADIFVSDERSWNNQGKSACFIDSTLEGSCFLFSRLEKKTVGMIEFYIMATSQNDYFGIRLYSESSDSIHLGPQISIREGKIQYFDKSRIWQTASSADVNSWYFIQLVFDCDKQYYNLFINNKIVAEKVTWTGTSVPNIELLYFLTFQNRICNRTYIDEVKYFSAP